jgi:hypothetical protein
MSSNQKKTVSSQKRPAGVIFEAALVWSLICLSIAVLLVVLAGTIDLLPASLVVVCRSTLTSLCAVFTLMAAGYTAIASLKSRIRS